MDYISFMSLVASFLSEIYDLYLDFVMFLLEELGLHTRLFQIY
jgi:hypothetical protein